MYFKPTDIHQLLDKTSFHPKHTFSGILKSQITRFYRICSEPSEFENLIYLYTCNICQIQYIGETKNSLKERANAHRSQIMCKDSNHLYKHLVSNPISHSIDTSITHDDTHFTLTPVELIKDFGEPLLNTFERLKRESYWMVLIGTIKPYGLNTKSVDFATKYQPPFKKILPFVVPFSKTANLAAKIIKKHYKKLKNDDEFDVFDFDVITAYSRHTNLSDYLYIANYAE